MIDWREIQERLRNLGFDPGPIDGVRGPKTDSAIVAFKRSIGLRARPYLGPLTLEALMGKGVKTGDPVQHSYPEGDMPWMNFARDMLSVHEARDVGRLSKWFDKSVSWIDPREVAWCGAFVATCLRKWQPGIDLPENPLGARNWQHFGQRVQPQLGAVMVFWRGSKSGWKGHVGFYWGEDATHYHILGGNQSNAVTITRIAKSRFLQARMPNGVQPKEKVVHLSPKGIPVTTNEA